MPHLRVRWPSRIVPLVMLARPWQGGQCLMDGRAPWRRRWMSVGVKRELRRSNERRAHECERVEHIGSYKCAPGSDNCPEIVSDDCRGTAIAEGGRQSERVAYGVQETKGPEASLVVRAPA